MAIPRNTAARKFYRAVQRRLDEASFLLNGGFHTIAIYLAGYTVEFMLKAWLLNSLTNSKATAMLTQFKGQRGHSYEWILEQIQFHTQQKQGLQMSRLLMSLSYWTTELRYAAQQFNAQDAQEFVASTRELFVLIDGRI